MVISNVNVAPNVMDQQPQPRQQQHGRNPRAHLQQLDAPKLGQYGIDSLQLFTSSLNSGNCVPSNRGTTEWLLDTGVTHHMTSQKRWLQDYKELSSGIHVYLGNNHSLMAIGVGDLHVTLLSGASVTISNIVRRAVSTCWRCLTKVVKRKQAMASNSMVEASRSGNKQREDQI
jgi:hypothetical protein